MPGRLTETFGRRVGARCSHAARTLELMELMEFRSEGIPLSRYIWLERLELALATERGFCSCNETPKNATSAFLSPP